MLNGILKNEFIKQISGYYYITDKGVIRTPIAPRYSWAPRIIKDTRYYEQSNKNNDIPNSNPRPLYPLCIT